MDFGVCAMQTVCQTHRHCGSFSHTHFISHQRIEKKRPYFMWLCIPEGKPIWHFKRFVKKGRAITRTMIRTKTTQTCVKTWHCESHWQKMLIGCIFFLNWKKRFPKRSLNLAVVLVCTSFYGESVDP